jgi:Tfp pilus assembly protein PilW
MMMSVTLGALLLAGSVGTYLQCLKAFTAAGNYTQIHGDGRSAVNWFAKDMRAASQITSFNGSNVTITIPTAFSASGVILSNKTVSYTYDGSNILYRTDSSTGKTAPLAYNIYQLTYTLFNHVGSNTTLVSAAKGIQLDIKLRKTMMNQTETEDYLSARFDMRNK